MYQARLVWTKLTRWWIFSYLLQNNGNSERNIEVLSHETLWIPGTCSKPVLTWRSSEAGSAEMITYERDPRHVDLLLRDCGLVHGKS